MTDHPGGWDICPNDECNQIEPEWVDGRCQTCGEMDPEYDDGEPEDGAWPGGGMDAGEITHRQEQARRLKR